MFDYLTKSVGYANGSAQRRIDAARLSFDVPEVLVTRALDIQPKEQTKTNHQKDESVRLEITFSKAQWQKLIKMRELLSNSLPNGSNWDQVLEYVSDRVIQQKDKTRVVNRSIAVKEPKSRQGARPPIPVTVQRQIFRRDQCCQFKDKHSGKQCGSTWRLEIDHIQPIWSGGSNELENLRVLCASHNRQVYRWQARLSQI